jgi:hypothetical protein
MSELIDRQALKAAHGLGTDCADCKRDARSCQYDRDFSRMDFCEWIDDAPTASPWRRVEDGLPEPHKNVLCMGRKGGCFVGWSIDNADRVKAKGYGRAYVHGGKARSFIHWMPLPEPPKEGA